VLPKNVQDHFEQDEKASHATVSVPIIVENLGMLFLKAGSMQRAKPVNGKNQNHCEQLETF